MGHSSASFSCNGRDPSTETLRVVASVRVAAPLSRSHSLVTEDGRRQWFLVLVLAFVVSRCVAAWAGLRFEAGYIDWYWQFIDPHLLREDLLRSLFYLHSQPPLFNLFAGAVLQLFPGGSSLVFGAAYFMLGLVLCVSSYLVLVTLKVRPRLAAIVVGVLIVGSASLLYEHALIYTYPVAVLLVVALAPLILFLRSGRSAWGVLFFLTLAAVCLTRSLFHLVWLIACVGIVFGAASTRRDMRRRVIGAALPALVLVSMVYMKNFWLFDSPAASSWLGMSLFPMASRHVEPAELEALHESGTISELFEVLLREGTTFVKVDSFPPRFISAPTTGVPVLDEKTRSGTHPILGSAVPNFNHLSYVAISRQYFDDALAVLVSHPIAYGRSVAENLALFARPSESFFGDSWSRNAAVLSPYTRAYDLVVKGSIPERASAADGRTLSDRWRGKGFFQVILFPVVVVGSWRLAWRSRLHRPVLAGVLLFANFNVVYTAVAANLLNFGESHRMFFLIEPSLFLLLALNMHEYLSRRAGAPRIE